MKIVEVLTNAQIAQFHKLPKLVYAEDTHYIPHIKQDIENIFSSTKNERFATGNAARWILLQEDKAVGRIAAFFDNSINEAGIGFFDCINNQQAAFTLFDTAILWLQNHNIKQIFAPINFGERDKYWGLLVDGFQRPSFQENYNPPYYQAFFENYGFDKCFEQTTSEALPQNVDTAKLNRISNLVQKKYAVSARHLNIAQMDFFIQDFCIIYNTAWAERDGTQFKPLSTSKVRALFHTMKPILQEDLLWFAYSDGKPIAFYLNVVDINTWMKYVNGDLNVWGKIKFLWAKKFVKITRIRGIVFGVVPEFQGKGVYAVLINEVQKVMHQKGYTACELAWIGDFNPKMHALFANLKASPIKRHITFEKKL